MLALRKLCGSSGKPISHNPLFSSSRPQHFASLPDRFRSIFASTNKGETNEVSNVNQSVTFDGLSKLVELNKRVSEFALSFTETRQFLRTACSEMLQRLREYDDRCKELGKKSEEVQSIANEVREILEKSEEIEELFSGHVEREVMTEKLRNSVEDLKSAEKLLEELYHCKTKQETKTMLAELMLRLSDQILPKAVKEKLNLR